MIDMCNKANIAISRVNTIDDVLDDVYVKHNLLNTKDPISGKPGGKYGL